MIKNILRLIVCLVVVISIPVRAEEAPALIITEIMYDVMGSDSGKEWFEVKNVSVDDVIIGSDFRVHDGSFHGVSAIGTTTIPAGAFAIFASNAEIWQLEYPNFEGILFDTVLSLTNTSSTLSIARGSEFIDSVLYHSSWGAQGNGYTLERNLFNTSTPPLWAQSSVLGGTPGFYNDPAIEDDTNSSSATSTEEVIEEENETTTEENSSPTNNTSSGSVTNYQVIVSELYPNPPGSDDGEWVEIYNNGSSSVNLSGFSFQDNSQSVYKITAETIIQPGSYFVLHRATSRIALNNTGGDTLKIFSPENQLLDSAVYADSAREGYSYAKINGSWRWTSTPTPGTANVMPPNVSPQAVITVTPAGPYYRGDVITFDGSQSSDPEEEGLSFLWNFGDGATDNKEKNSHAYTAVGEYVATLTVTDIHNASSVASRAISILAPLSAPSTPTSTPESPVSSSTPVFIRGNDLLISEVFPDPEGSDEAEFVELFNASSVPLDISGLLLDDVVGGSKPYQFPHGSIIQPFAYTVIAKKDSKLTLNNDTDSVRILQADGTLILEISYEKPKSGFSYSWDSVNLEYVWTKSVSPGGPFIVPAAETTNTETPVVLGEEMSSISSFSDITEDFAGSILQVRGVVLVPPGVAGRQKIYIAEPTQNTIPEGPLLELYQYRGQFPALKFGDEIQVEGELSWLATGPRIKIISAEAVQKINTVSVARPEPLEIFELTEEYNRQWVTVSGVVDRINTKSISLISDDMRLMVYPHQVSGLWRTAFTKGDIVHATGFLDYKSGKPTLLLVQQEDITEAPEELPEASENPDSVPEIIRPSPESGRELLMRWYYLASVPVVGVLGFFGKRFWGMLQ